MWYPQGYLRPGSGSLPICSWPVGSSEPTISRSEGLAIPPSGSAFSPLPGSAIFTGPFTDFSSTLMYSATFATGLPACLGSPNDVDTSRLAGAIRCHPHRSLGYPYPLTDPGYRSNAARDATAVLKSWLEEHEKNPYPTKGEKIMLAVITKMTLTQVSTWFANARRRLKKDNKVTWAGQPRSGNEDEDEECQDGGKNPDCLGKSVDKREPPAEEGVNFHIERRRDNYSPVQSNGASASFRAPDTVCNIQKEPLEGCLSLDPLTSSATTTVEVRDLNHNRRDLKGSSVSHSGAPLDRRISWGAQTQTSKPKLWSLAEIATSDPKDRRDRQGPSSTLINVITDIQG
ncbi:hypothetical protein MATL_G00233490 [Megalops atlanticus]|uniref:Homeobox domain-containing protein n=1 Tax=Megalops atlanticus TaxID=7932 RepID=A0A9D3SVZ5_MEGAT|nr:hypothetical protein MATL_G00233490 [Megalops atlanticus]